VDDYLDSFLILVLDTSYMDSWTLVVKFRWGLKLNVQSQITTMPFGRHIDTNLEAWYAAVQRIDQAWLANEAFQSTLCSMTLTPTHSALLRLTPLPILHPPLVALSQTSFGHISINSLSILTVSMATESP